MKAVTGYALVLDEHVQKMLAIMQENVPANKLCAVAEAVRDIGALIWAHHRRASVRPLSFVADSIGTTSCETRSIATQSDLCPERADDDFAAVGRAL